MPQFVRDKLVRTMRSASDAAAEMEMLEFMYEPEHEEIKQIFTELDRLANRASTLVSLLNEQAEKRGSEIKKSPQVEKNKFNWQTHDRRVIQKRKRTELEKLEKQLSHLKEEFADF